MAYSDFILSDLENKFGVQHQKNRIHFPINLIEPSKRLVEDLNESANMPIKSEKARSEWIVVPILKELRRINENFFTIYSGENLIADKKKGLFGECDFILSKDTKSYEISFPIFQIVEAKKNDLDEGIKQCAAQLIGAKIFNEKKGIKTPVIYGCTTTGDDWIFLELNENYLTIDNRKYYLAEIKELLGVFQYIINMFK
jgi:hypothetical protein